MWMKHKDHKVDMQVKLQFFCVEISAYHINWNQLLPCFEKLLGLASIEGLGKHA
jgi:hypothetical protein